MPLRGTSRNFTDRVDAKGPFWYDCLRYQLMENRAEEVQGVVEEALPNTLFRVKIGDAEPILAYLAGKMRLHRIKVLVGDKVLVQLDPYGGKGRITRRL